jgi:hypothetical protein
MRCLPSSLLLFFFGYVPIWLAHHSKKKKQWRLPKTEGSILNCTVPPLWPTYRWKEDTIFQSIWDKSEEVWELLGTKEKWKKMTHTLVSLGTKDKRTWCIHTDIRSRVCLFGSCGFRVYNTRVTHVKKKEQMIWMLSNFMITPMWLWNTYLLIHSS